MGDCNENGPISLPFIFGVTTNFVNELNRV